MTTTVFRRPPRRRPPDVPRGELSLQEPPVLPEAGGGGFGHVLMYVPMALLSGGMMLMYARPGSGGGGVVTYVMAGLMVVSTLGMMMASMGAARGDRRRRLVGERRDYLRYLSQTRRIVRRAAGSQRQVTNWMHPHPGALWTVVLSDRLWERRAEHDDFAEIRIATGEQRLGLRIMPLQTKPVTDLEPVSARALRRFISTYTTLSGQPMALRVREFPHVRCEGDPRVVRDLVRALVAQLATFHSPEDVRIAVCAGEDELPDWEWVKWLPHALHGAKTDAAGQARLVSATLADLEVLLDPQFAERPEFAAGAPCGPEEQYVLIVLDGGVVSGAERVVAGCRNATVLDLSNGLPRGGHPGALRLRIADGLLHTVRTDHTGAEKLSLIGTPDRLSRTRAGALGRAMARYRAGVSTDSAKSITANTHLTELLGITDPEHLDPTHTWRPRSVWDQLRVPIGVTPDGAAVELDIKEAARGGMGPHGMLVGATGSGKSELLRTLVLSLALTHSPERLNFVLVDFKGGATFLGCDELPHTSAVITNLADELPLVQRMHAALHGELVRRQELLRKAGNFSSVHEYDKARVGGAALDPLPTLFVVVDEFSELLAAHPDFIDLFVMIGRLGRSLGVHLLLASQRLDEGRMHQLETHLSYRIGLRTFSSMESRAVIGVADAYELPSAPGNGFLKTDTSTLIRFKAAYVSGPLHRPDRRTRQSVVQQQIVSFSARYTAPRATTAVMEEEPDGDEAPTLMSAVIERLRGLGPAAHQVWLPPLDAPQPLDQVLPPLVPDPGFGLTPENWAGRGGLAVPVGVVDRPFDQVRDLLMADVSGAGGHVGIAGAPQSGKSTLVRTLITSLALCHTPQEVQVYCLDFGGSTLSGLSGLPHVGGSTGRHDRERVSRTVVQMLALLHDRELRFQQHGVESMAAYRRARRTGAHQDDPYGDVFLVIDGWYTMQQEFEGLMDALGELAARGLNYGLHLVVTCARWSELRSWLRDQLGTKFELRLGDSIESDIDVRAAAHVPREPGFGLTPDKLHFRVAIPRIDGVEDVEDLAEGTEELVSSVAGGWQGARAPEVHLRVALGWDEVSLSPLWHDFSQHAHLLAIGDAESGKTNLLRLVARAVVERFTPAQARILLGDPRRELAEIVPAEHRLGYAVNAQDLQELAEKSAASLRQRVPGADITSEQLRRRDWWQGPRLFVIVDDYEMVSSNMTGPLDALIPLLAHGADIGLHVVLARASSGSARALLDSLPRRMWEQGAPALLFSCTGDDNPFLTDARPKLLVPGRTQVLTRRGTKLLQTAHVG